MYQNSPTLHVEYNVRAHPGIRIGYIVSVPIGKSTPKISHAQGKGNDLDCCALKPLTLKRLEKTSAFQKKSFSGLQIGVLWVDKYRFAARMNVLN